MIHHLVFWNLKEELSESERKEAALTVKRQLEAVKSEVAGILSLEVKINELPSSNRDIALISAFESEAALNAYQKHPAHVKAASYVGSVTCNRTCFDYIDE
ncbi:MAG: Dabb family protein [Clostridiales bacterium]|nr:Dabb family protein [Clostridiales bacterium]